MSQRDPKKFDPARAHLLDAPERERYLPTDQLVALLDLQGAETVLDYGAGTGRLTRAVADALTGDGQVIAVDESTEMFERLSAQLADSTRARPLHITDNHVPLPDDGADRVLAVNLLHEVRGESALAEMHRLLAPGGFVLVVDWERGRERDSGPPDQLLYTAAEAADELRAAGLVAEPLDAALPFHFAVKATKPRHQGHLMLFRRSNSLTPSEAAAALTRGELQLVDVREPAELAQARVDGAKHIPLAQLAGRLGELDRERPVAFLCASGNRSAMATRAASKAGLDASNVAGGIKRWASSGLPVNTGARRGAA